MSYIKYRYSLLFLAMACFCLCFMGLASIASAARVNSSATAQQYQAQSQGQSQGQSSFNENINVNAPKQGQQQSTSVNYNPAVTIEKTEPVFNNSFNSYGHRIPRMLPHTPDTFYPGTPSLFFSPEKDSGPLFVNAGLLVKMLNMANKQTIEVDDDDVKVTIQPVLATMATPMSEESLIKFEIINKDTKFIPIAYITVAAEDWVNSVTLAAVMKREAQKFGASRVILTKEGVTNIMCGNSKSFGLNPSISMTGGMGVGSSLGGVGAGGMGVAQAKGFYLKAPFIAGILSK